MVDIYKKRRIVIFFIALLSFSLLIISNSPPSTKQSVIYEKKQILGVSTSAIQALSELKIKGRAPKTGYSRDQFGSGWSLVNGCDSRNIILNRDLSNVTIDEKCNVLSGTLNDPYTGKIINFKRGSGTSSLIQIDHVVSLSDAWQKGAQSLSKIVRIKLANDPLELLAVDGSANLQKSDGDAASWLPPNKLFRCQYIARQISVKQKYNLWVTQSEHNVMKSILDKCPKQMLPSP